MCNKIKCFIKFRTVSFCFFVVLIFLSFIENAYSSEEVNSVPVKFTLFSPYTDFDFFYRTIIQINNRIIFYSAYYLQNLIIYMD